MTASEAQYNSLEVLLALVLEKSAACSQAINKLALTVRIHDIIGKFQETEHDTEAVEAQKQRLQQATESSKDIDSEGVAGTSVEEHSKDAMAAAKETDKHNQDAAGGLAEHGDEKVRGVSSSSS